MFVRVHFVVIHVGEIDVGPILEHLISKVTLNDMCYVADEVSTNLRWRFAALNNNHRIQKGEFARVAFPIMFICKLFAGR